MAPSPEVTDDRLVLRGGIWCDPHDRREERWSADAAVDPIHAALATHGVDAEREKSRRDIEYVLEHARDGILLDVGCGYGRLAKYLLPRRVFDCYVGIDGSATMLQLFRERYDTSPLEQRTPLLLVQSAIDDVKLSNASVDTVVIAAVLLHNPKPVARAVLREAHRVLRPGGRLLVLNDLPNSRTPAALPNRLYVRALEVTGRGDRNGPVRTYSRREVDSLFAAFDDVEVRPTGRAVLPKRLPGLPATASRRYRTHVHDPVQRWAERRLPASWLDRLYFNVCVSASR
jgi:SAM-dependent methyltransferase